MAEREELVASIVGTIKTYRAGEIAEPNAEHVEKWVGQFTPQNQLLFLREFDHVMKKSFITKERVTSYLARIIQSEKLAGKNPRDYWLSANILDIQKDGQSQTSMVNLFYEQLLIIFGITRSQCGSPDGDFIYLDDVIFSGGRIMTDMAAWIEGAAPAKANVQVVVLAWHQLGQYQLSNKIAEIAKQSNKKITARYWRFAEIENRRARKNSSEVLWPVSTPDIKVVNDYMARPQKFAFEPRAPGFRVPAPFSSEEGRQVLEYEFLVAGAQIRSQGQVAEINRPLGHGYFGLGFGATIATYRNCPNNCPLALWWGNPQETSGALKWYPLLPRKNYSSAENVLAKFFK